MYRSRGDKKVFSTPWTDSSETYEGMKVLKQRTLTLDVKVTGNPFVSVVPTTQNWKLIERSDRRFFLRILTRIKGVPGSDTFENDEEWYCASNKANSNSCVLRTSFK